MAKIVEYRDVPLDDLTIGKAQARTSPSMADVDELASSIEKLGLLQPIVVCESVEAGRWEILTGQRRFLAHKRLGRKTIPAAILDGLPVVADAVKLARAMGPMSGVQQKKLAKVRERAPEGSVEEAIERAKSADKVTQINATVTIDVHAALRRVAVDEGMNQDETAAMLIEEALLERGLLGS